MLALLTRRRKRSRELITDDGNWNFVPVFFFTSYLEEYLRAPFVQASTFIFNRLFTSDDEFFFIWYDGKDSRRGVRLALDPMPRSHTQYGRCLIFIVMLAWVGHVFLPCSSARVFKILLWLMRKRFKMIISFALQHCCYCCFLFSECSDEPWSLRTMGVTTPRTIKLMRKAVQFGEKKNKPRLLVVAVHITRFLFFVGIPNQNGWLCQVK